MSQAESRNITPSLPRALPKAAAVKVHKAVERHLAAIEAHREAADALIVFLDEESGEPDDEDDGTTEPSLGSYTGTCPEHVDQGDWPNVGYGNTADDREQDVGDEGEAFMDEDQSLGWSHDVNQQRALWNEQQCSNAWSGHQERDDSEREPNLGAHECVGSVNAVCWSALRHFSQQNWAAGLGGELEGEHDGREPDVDDEREGDHIGGGGSEADLY